MGGPRVPGRCSGEVTGDALPRSSATGRIGDMDTGSADRLIGQRAGEAWPLDGVRAGDGAERTGAGRSAGDGRGAGDGRSAGDGHQPAVVAEPASDRLDGRVALVTGAGSPDGIGYAI